MKRSEGTNPSVSQSAMLIGLDEAVQFVHWSAPTPASINEFVPCWFWNMTGQGLRCMLHLWELRSREDSEIGTATDDGSEQVVV